MLKYIITALVGLSLLACESEQQTTQDPAQNAPDQQSQEQFQPNQSAADIEVTDKELDKFTEVSMAAQQVQAEAQQEMIAIVEEEGLDVQTYNTIAEARFNNKDESALDVSSEEIEKFNAASSEIEGMQAEVEQEMTEVVEAEGMEMERFMEINMALQQNQQLQQRMQRKMMESMQQQGQGQQRQTQGQ